MVKSEEMRAKNKWVKDHFAECKVQPDFPVAGFRTAGLPFSFIYGSQLSETLLAKWAKKTEKNRWTKTVFSTPQVD